MEGEKLSLKLVPLTSSHSEIIHCLRETIWNLLSVFSFWIYINYKCTYNIYAFYRNRIIWNILVFNIFHLAMHNRDPSRPVCTDVPLLLLGLFVRRYPKVFSNSFINIAVRENCLTLKDWKQSSHRGSVVGNPSSILWGCRLHPWPGSVG